MIAHFTFEPGGRIRQRPDPKWVGFRRTMMRYVENDMRRVDLFSKPAGT